MMRFEDAFSYINQEHSSITSIRSLIASEFPATLKALRIIDTDCVKNKRRKGYNLQKVENKKFGQVYYVRYTYQGKLIKFHTHKDNPEEAEKFAKENKERLIEQYARSHDAKTYTILEQFYEENSEYLLCEEKRNQKISDRIRKEYYAVIKNRFVPFLKKKNVKTFTDITHYILGDFQDALLAEMKPQTVNNIFKAVKRVFKYLLRKGLIKDNPCNSIHYIPVHQEDQGIRGCYELEKLKRVFDHRWKDELSYLLCLLIYTTGMRNSEITKVTVEDIKRISGCYFISIKESKTPSGIRMVPLHNFVYKRIHNFCSKKDPKKPIFGWHNPETFVKANRQLAKKLNVGEEELYKENITFYSGRHFWKTMMNAGGLGEDIEEVFMGHKVSNDVAKRYNHRDKQGKDRIIEKANRVYKILDQYIFGGNKKALETRAL